MDDAAYVRGALLFDRGDFFEAHEAWEDRWRVTGDDAERLLLQGLIQVAAAFHKRIVMGSPASAARLLARGLAKLEAGSAAVSGFDRAAFVQALHGCAVELASEARFDRSRVPGLLRPRTR